MRPSHVTSVSFNPATLFVTKIAHIKNITNVAHIMNLSSITHILAVWGLALGLLLLACVYVCVWRLRIFAFWWCTVCLCVCECMLVSQSMHISLLHGSSRMRKFMAAYIYLVAMTGMRSLTFVLLE